jgi:hypothetical protein
MLTRTQLSGKEVEITFRMPPLEGVVELYLCGDFNDWHMASTPLVQEEDGSWAATLVLEAGKSYRFRYYDNQGRWHNDWEADAYLPNSFGTEDSIVDLIGMGSRETQQAGAASAIKKPAAKKPAEPKPARKAPAPKKPAAKKAGPRKGAAAAPAKPRRAGRTGTKKGR